MVDILFSILTVSVSITPIIVVMIILTPILNRIYKYSWTYWMWLVIALRLMLPFSSGAISSFYIKFPTAENIIYANSASNGVPIENSIVNAINSQTINTNIVEIIAAFYILGVAIFMIFKLINYYIFRKNIRKWCSKPSDEIIEIVSNVGQMYGVNIKKRKINILICKNIHGPMVAGILKPMLLLPEETYDSLKLKMILKHEIIHIKRHDTAYKFLFVIVSAIHWFNPFVHIMSQKANNDLEISCDIKALKESDIEEKKMYSLMIIDIASQNPSSKVSALFTGFGSQKENLESRIKYIFSSNGKKDGHIILMIVIVIILLFGGFIQIGSISEAAEVGGDSSVDNYIDSEIYDEVNKGEFIEPNDIDIIEEPEYIEKSNIESNINDSHISDDADIDNHHNERQAEIVIIDLNQLNENEESENNQEAE